MPKKILIEDRLVLRAKFQEAQNLVSFYEKRIEELRTCLQVSCCLNEEPSILRAKIHAVNNAILTMPFSKSLIASNYARIIKRLGDKYKARVQQTYSEWVHCNESLLSITPESTTPDQERKVLAAFASANCEMFICGILPVRILRDHYAAARRGKQIQSYKREKRGRRQDPLKPDRDRAIFVAFQKLTDKPHKKYRELANQFRIGIEAIRKIVRQQKALSEKLGI